MLTKHNSMLRFNLLFNLKKYMVPRGMTSSGEPPFHERMRTTLETGEGDVNKARIVLGNAERRQTAVLTGLRGANRTAALKTLYRQAA